MTVKFWEMLKNASEVTLLPKNIVFLKILNFVQSFVKDKVSLADGTFWRFLATNQEWCSRSNGYMFVHYAVSRPILQSLSAFEDFKRSEDTMKKAFVDPLPPLDAVEARTHQRRRYVPNDEQRAYDNKQPSYTYSPQETQRLSDGMKVPETYTMRNDRELKREEHGDDYDSESEENEKTATEGSAANGW